MPSATVFHPGTEHYAIYGMSGSSLLEKFTAGVVSQKYALYRWLSIRSSRSSRICGHHLELNYRCLSSVTVTVPNWMPALHWFATASISRIYRQRLSRIVSTRTGR